MDERTAALAMCWETDLPRYALILLDDIVRRAAVAAGTVHPHTEACSAVAIVQLIQIACSSVSSATEAQVYAFKPFNLFIKLN